MILYHATSKENKETILKEGFKISNGRWKENQLNGKYFQDNVFGEGVYFTTIEENTIDYGEDVIKCEVSDEYVVGDFIILNDRNTVRKIENIKCNSKKNHYKAISVYFKEGNYKEIIVYEPSIIKIIEN